VSRLLCESSLHRDALGVFIPRLRVASACLFVWRLGVFYVVLLWFVVTVFLPSFVNLTGQSFFKLIDWSKAFVPVKKNPNSPKLLNVSYPDQILHRMQTKIFFYGGKHFP
jgi:hypothetical protein